MAIDTAEKRRSLSGIQSTLLPGVTPLASPDVEWRQEACWGYPGIAPQIIQFLIGSRAGYQDTVVLRGTYESDTLVLRGTREQDTLVLRGTYEQDTLEV